MIKIDRNVAYPLSLLLSIPRKTCEALSDHIGTSGDSVIKMLNKSCRSAKELISTIKKITQKKLYLIIDDTIISKIYSKYIEGACDNYSTTTGKTERSLCSVVAMLTDGEIAIPVDQSLWISKEFIGGKKRTKSMIAKDLIEKIIELTPIHGVLIDGLYTTEYLMSWLIQKNIRFDGRFHSNRSVENKSKTAQIKELQSLKVSGKKPIRSTIVKWKKMKLHVTSLFRRNVAGREIITYYASNYKAPKKEHVYAYGIRWNIEKFFRTAKQKLGLNDCMVRNRDGQEKHIANVFFAYALLQIEKHRHKLKNVETLISSIKSYNFTMLQQRFIPAIRNFCYA